MDIEVQCPFCGEPGEIDEDIDEGAPGEHSFVQDCAVCCRPWAVRVVVGTDGNFSIAVDRA
jgi:hypothetical protein